MEDGKEVSDEEKVEKKEREEGDDEVEDDEVEDNEVEEENGVGGEGAGAIQNTPSQFLFKLINRSSRKISHNTTFN